jgi:3'-phosphoadenosine 5'-phosphosulfate sulfotransferase (PAPS reductase)/FAD synthetase
MFSGGVGSWAAARRVVEKHGTEDLVLLFADTLIEDEDTYRFLREAAANVGGQLVEIADGRTPWDWRG